MSWPTAEIVVTPSLVKSLLAEQHPQLAALVLREVGFGFDNAIWRVSEDLVARLPWREVAASLMVNELTWLPVLASRLTLPTPVSLHRGHPGQAFPWSWSISAWIQGHPGDELDAGQRRAAATHSASSCARCTLRRPTRPRGTPCGAHH